MKFLYQIRTMKGVTSFNEENLSHQAFKDVKLGEKIRIDSYLPDTFPSTNFVTCVEVEYEYVNGTEFCCKLFETSYLK